MTSVRERIDSDDLFLDSAIVSHGFAAHLRDSDIVIDVPATLPPHVPIGDTMGSYIMGRYRYRFTHCVEARVVTDGRDDTWRESWDDLFIDYEEWERAGSPNGFVWGVGHADAYPGLSYTPTSSLAGAWMERLGHEMHEVAVESNTFTLTLVFHDLIVQRLAIGDPRTGELKPVPSE